MLKQLLNNPLNPLVGDYEMVLQDAMKQLDNAWSKLVDDVDLYNTSVNERDKLEKHLHKLNIELAVMENGMLIGTLLLINAIMTTRKENCRIKRVRLEMLQRN